MEASSKEVSMNLSIIARCDRTGQFGLAAASVSIARGGDFDGAVRPRVGAVLIQGARSFRLNRLAVNLLEIGHSPSRVLAQVLREDADHACRQIVVLDRGLPPAVHAGAEVRGAGGIKVGGAHAVAYEGAADANAAEAALASLQASSAEELDLRLLRALEAAAPPRRGGALQGAASDIVTPLRSAAMVVWGERDYSDLDLRVDLHADPIGELRRIYDDFKPTAAYYEERARNPGQAVSAREFAGLLSQKR
jgi:uncharacterized Ntn-hydrolase superfamily protein